MCPREASVCVFILLFQDFIMSKMTCNLRPSLRSQVYSFGLKSCDVQ